MITPELFAPDSAVCHRALMELRDVLDQLGFCVAKKPAKEATLRVYPRQLRRYPLLNPRFSADSDRDRPLDDRAFVIFTVLSKGDDALDRHLQAFVSNNECRFIPDAERYSGYFRHGWFALPLQASIREHETIDFAAMGEGLRRMRDHLQAFVSPG